MTNQEVFNKVYTHLLTQMEPCKSTSLACIMDEEGNPIAECAYRGPNGLKCAIGCLIPDSLYSRSMENNSIKHLIDTNLSIKNLFSSASEDLLIHLQFIHDEYSVESWKSSLEELAQEHNLTVPNHGLNV